MRQAELADGTILEFPDETTDEVMQTAVKNYIASQQAPERSQEKIPKNDMGLGETAYNALVEAAYKANRSVAEMVDFFGTDIINAGLSGIGADAQLPSAVESLDKYAGASDLPEGILKDVSGAVGETALLGAGAAGLLKQGAKQLPAMTAGESVSAGMLRQVGDITPQMMSAETALSGVSGGAAELASNVTDSPTGSAVAETVAGVVAPLSVSGAAQVGKRALSGAREAFKNVYNPVPKSVKEKRKIADMANDLILQEAKGSGLTYDEIVNKYANFDEIGTLMDVDPIFANAVRTVAVEDAGLRGQLKRQVTERQRGQGDRLDAVLDSSLGTRGGDLTKQIDELETNLAPKITQLYSEARDAPFSLSPKLAGMMENPQGLFKKSARSANEKLETMEALGEDITPIVMIDAHKKALDDAVGEAVRAGRMDEARLLVKAKNAMIEQADLSVPKYKEARETFAGKQSLYNAADLGQTFFKPATQARDIADHIKNMTDQEKYFYKLGVKRAFQDALGKADMNRDMAKVLLNKRNMDDKLKLLFDDPKQLESVKKTMRDEADFVISKNAIQGGSDTAMKFKDTQRLSQQMGEIAADLTTSNLEKSRQLIGISKGFNKQTNEEMQRKAKIQAAEFLSSEGVDPAKVEALLQIGRERELLKIINQTARKYKAREQYLPVTSGAAAASGIKDNVQTIVIDKGIPQEEQE